MKNKKRKLTISILIALIVILLIVFNYGHDIPLVKNIPHIKGEQEHQYIPVMNNEGEIEYWTCAMHPSVRLNDPGICPVCGMDLVPVAKAQELKDEHNGSGTEMDSMKSMNSGETKDMSSGAPEQEHRSSVFRINPRRQQLINVKTEPVEVRNLTKDIRTVGKVVLDETKIEHIHTKFSGWIDKVFVDFTWEHVKKGDPLFSIYSPDLLSTQEEYLIALKSKKILVDSEFPDISKGSESLVRATRNRLKLWDVSEDQIRDIERTGKVKKSIVFHSPITGHVSEKNTFENQYVEPGTLLYTIADHSTVWINADVYEDEIPLVKVGQEATLTVDSLPGEEFHGKVKFVWPHLMPETRTGKVRFEFPNPDLKLLPEMFANVDLQIPVGKKLSVTDSAVLRTGKNNVVFVNKGDGFMEIRKVEIGRKAGGYYEVLRGLKEGEIVVSRANFLIDAESKLQAAVAAWNDGDVHDVTIESEPEDKGQKGNDMQNMHMH